MIDSLVPVAFDAKSAGPEFWKRYHAFRRARHAEVRPDDPIRPDDLEQQRMQRDDPFEIVYRYEISRGDQMLSWFGGTTMKAGTPGYESNKHLFSGEISVHRDMRRHGIGRSWLPLLVDLMDRHGCTVFTTSTQEESGHKFLKWLGADAKLTDVENRLRLADVDWRTVQRWTTEGAERSPDTRLEMHDGRIPEALWDGYARDLTSLLRFVPLEGLDHGEFIVTPDHIREWYVRMDIDEARHHVVLAREPDGEVSGMTDLAWAVHRPTLIYQQFTGVRPDARGRGLGKWLKAAMLGHVHELYPDARWIVTDNAGSNEPMLAINKKLGFKPYRTVVAYQIGRDALAAGIS